MRRRFEPGSSILCFLTALSLLGTACQSGGVRAGPGRHVGPVCAPGYRPTGPGGECVDITGTPQGQTPTPVVRPPPPEAEEWLGDYSGTCGEVDCRMSLAEAAGELRCCVLGNGRMAEILVVFDGEKTADKTIRVKRIASIEAIEECHMLFIDPSEKQKLRAILERVDHWRSVG